MEENVAFFVSLCTVIVKHFSHQLYQVFQLHFKTTPPPVYSPLHITLEPIPFQYVFMFSYIQFCVENIVIYMKIYTKSTPLSLLSFPFPMPFIAFRRNHCLMERVANSGYDI